MEKSVLKKLKCEMVGGESYEYYPLGQYIVVAPGACGDRPSNIRALMSIMRWAFWQQGAQWSRLHTVTTCQSKQSRKH
jgi:hypothetical protein